MKTVRGSPAYVRRVKKMAPSSAPSSQAVNTRRSSGDVSAIRRRARAPISAPSSAPSEAAKVAATEGYRFSGSMVERAEELCTATAENVSSMLQDIRAGRRTEIESISGEILRRATMASLPTPRTRVIYQLVRSLESR